MSEEKKEPEKAPIDEKKKNALLRYVAIMFAVAFLLVLLSMVTQVRANKTAINQLSQSSSSAIKRAEQLQDNNRLLEENNEFLKEELEELQDQLDEMQEQLEKSKAETEEIKEESSKLKEAHAKETGCIKQAYDLLLDGSEAALEKLETYKDYLGPKGLERYEAIKLEKGE